MTQKEPARPQRCMLFSAKNPKGQIFEGEDAIDAALDDGWLDTPPANRNAAIAETKTDAAAAEEIKALEGKLEHALKLGEDAIDRADNAEGKVAGLEDDLKKANAEIKKLSAKK